MSETDQTDETPDTLVVELKPPTITPEERAKSRLILEKARIIFSVRAPYWFNTLTKLIPHEIIGFGTFGVTSRGQLLYDPLAVIKYGGDGKENVIAGILAHEVLHVILEYFARMGNKNPRRWNVSQDLFINGMLREVGWELPDCGVFPEQFKHKDTGEPLPPGLTADEYYRVLPEYVGGGQSGPCSGECGSGAGNPFSEEPKQGELGPDGERTEDEMKSVVEQAARATAEAAKTGCGTIPSHMRMWAEQALLPPKVKWTDKLSQSGREVLRKAGRGRRTYSRLHRRQACMGRGPRTPLLPSRNSTQCNIWFAIDTSGSMGIETEIRRAVSELKSILQNRAGKVHILACDAEVQGKPKRVQTIDEVLPMLTGGGGTDFRPIFDEALALSPRDRPDLIVVATDGGGPAPEVDPGIPTVWLLIGEYAHEPTNWGEIIKVEN